MKIRHIAFGVLVFAGAAIVYAANRPAGYVTICTESNPSSCPSVPANTNVAYGRADQFTFKLISGSFPLPGSDLRRRYPCAWRRE